MKKILLLILLALTQFAKAQINTYIITQTGQAEFDTSRVFKRDSNVVFVPKYGIDSARSTINTQLGLRVKYSDTSGMLSHYFRKTDSTAMLLPYMRKVDTSTLSSRINLKVNISDTAGMLTPYLRKIDTSAMLSPYLQEVDTAAMLTPYARKISPSLTTPNIGAATGVSLNTGTTLNGTIFAKSNNAFTLLSTDHGETIGNEATGQNMALGVYSTGVGLQGRNNGAVAATNINPLGGDVRFGISTPAGLFNITGYHTGTGTGDYCSFELRNGAGTVNDAMIVRNLGTSFTTSGPNIQDGGVVMTGSSLSGGLSTGTRGSASFRVYTNDVLRTTWAATTGDISTTGKVVSTGGGLGYATGAGGTVTQLTSRSTSVTLNKLCGTITMFSAAQAADAIVTFTFTNSFIASTDFVLLQHISATNGGAWEFSVVAGAGSCTVTVRNTSGSSITEATPIRFTIIKATTN